MNRDPVLAYTAGAQQAGQRWGIPTAVLLGLTWVESRGNIHAVSPKGAFGLTQFTPPTAAEYGVVPGDPHSQLEGAAHYLHDLGYATNPRLALRKYNAGPNAPQNAGTYDSDVLTAARRYGNVKIAGSASVTATTTADNAATQKKKSGGLLGKWKDAALTALLWIALLGAGSVLAIAGVRRAAGAGAPA